MTQQGTTQRRWRRTRVLAIALVTATVGLAGCTSSDRPNVTAPELAEGKLPAELVSTMQDAVSVAVAAAGGSGAVVGVWVPWSGSWVAGVGTTELGGSEPVTAEMPIRIGEISRSMTCDVLYELAEDGKVGLNDSAAGLVPGVPNLSEVTVAQLCDSTSGLGSLSAQTTDRMLHSAERVWEPRQLASFGLGSDPLAAPGERFIDSDTGYLLLGLALERASGMKAREYISEYVAEPLGLDSTVLPKAAPAAPSEGGVNGYITPHNAEGGWACEAPTNVTTVSSSTGWTDSGVVSTITDLGVYGRALAEQTLADGKKNDRYDPQVLISDNLPSWFTTAGGVQFAGGMMGHDGSTLGYSTALWSDPATGVTVAVSINNSTVGSGIIRALSWQLAALAATAPATGGQTVPEFGVPWTAEEQAQSVRDQAICPVP